MGYYAKGGSPRWATGMAPLLVAHSFLPPCILRGILQSALLKLHLRAQHRYMEELHCPGRRVGAGYGCCKEVYGLRRHDWLHHHDVGKG